MMTKRSSRAMGSPEGGVPASLGLIRGRFLKKGKCELSFKELLHPLTSPPTPSCVSLFTVLGACQICFLPQGLCTRYPFCLDCSSLDIQVAVLSLSFRSPLACHFVRWGFSDSCYYSLLIKNSAYVILCLLAQFIFLHNIYRPSHISSLIVSLSYKNVS